jgi:hypothetical protein
MYRTVQNLKGWQLDGEKNQSRVRSFVDGDGGKRIAGLID